MARTQKVTKENNIVNKRASDEELETLLTIPSKADIQESKLSTFIMTAKFKGLHLNGKIFDNMKVVLFECKAANIKEAKEKFITVIEKVFPNENANEFISHIFGTDIQVEEYDTVNKITTNFFKL